MPADTTETVAEHSARLQPSINLHAPVTTFMFSCSLWYPMYYPGGMKARVSPVQRSKPHSILAPTQDPNPGGRIQNHKQWPLHYHCTLHTWMQVHAIVICMHASKLVHAYNIINKQKRFQENLLNQNCQHPWRHAFVHACLSPCTHACMHACTHACLHAHMLACLLAILCLCLSLCLCIITLTRGEFENI